MSISSNISRTIKSPDHSRRMVNHNAATQDIINLMLWADPLVAKDTQYCADALRGATVKDTCRNIYDALKERVRFIEDGAGVQDLQSPAQLWHSCKGDCKSFSLFIASNLQNLCIPYLYRFVSESDSSDVHHVYVVVPQADGTEIIIDATTPPFNKENSYAYHIEHVMLHRKQDETIFNSYKMANDGDAKGNRSVNGSMNGAHIGDITDKLLFKLAPNKRDELAAAIRGSITKASPVFLYLFYYNTQYARTPLRPLPRAAIYKLKMALELFEKMGEAFQMSNTYMVKSGFRLLRELIDTYFKNIPVLTKQEIAVDFSNTTGTKYVWNTTTSLLVYGVRSNDHDHQPGAGPAPYNNMQVQAANMAIHSNKNIQALLTSYKQGNTWSIPATEAMISTLYAQFINYKNPDNYGKTIAESLELLPLIKQAFTNYQLSNNAPANLQTPEAVINNSFVKSTSDNCWCVGYYTARSDNGNLVILCHTDDFQNAEFANAFPKDRFVFLDMRFHSGDASAKELPRVHKIIKNLKQGNVIGFELDTPALAGSSQNIICGIFKLPAILTNKQSAIEYAEQTYYDRIVPLKVNKIKLLHNDSYEVTSTLATLTSIFDPDGLPLTGVPTSAAYKKFSTTPTTAYISGGPRVGDLGITAIIAIITAVTTILSTIAGIVGMILSFEAQEIVGNGAPADFRYNADSCKWHDQAAGILTCQLLDGSGWVFVDAATGTPVGDDPSPEGSGESGGNNMLLLAGAGLLAVVALSDN